VTELQVVVTWQIVGNGKVVVVVQFVPHHGLVAVVTTTTVDKLANCTDTCVLAVVLATLVAIAFAIAVVTVAPLASNAKTFALTVFALLALAVAVALETIALVTAHQIFHTEKTTVRGVKLTTKGVQEDDIIRHDVKAYRVGSKLKIRNPLLLLILS
jgi:hypothetical protein